MNILSWLYSSAKKFNSNIVIMQNINLINIDAQWRI